MKYLFQAYFTVRFRDYSKWSEELHAKNDQFEVSKSQFKEAQYLCAVIRRVAMPFGERTSCIIRALAAKKLLAQQGIVSEIVLGVPKLGVKHPNGWQAHAWLKVNDGVLVGRREARCYEALRRK